MPTQLRDAVVVVTGASSGIGRATALTFARQGANVVVAARSEAPLRDLVAECEGVGGAALAVPTDVADEAAVQALADAAVTRFGRLDVWVNNAGVGLYGRFTDLPPADFRRVLDTNFFGYVHGARAALPRFQLQGRGVLINNASVVGRAAGPYFTAYTASKFAVCGFTESLRQELRGTDIHACLILPASIDTPFFQHAGNYYDRAVKALTPVYTAEQVAAAIVSCAERPRREVMIGQAAPMLILLRTLAPALFERTMARQVEVDHFQEAPAVPGSGNLFAPQPPMGVISGGWKGREDTSLRHVTTAMVAALVPASLVWLWLHSRGSGARAS